MIQIHIHGVAHAGESLFGSLEIQPNETVATTGTIHVIGQERIPKRGFRAIDRTNVFFHDKQVFHTTNRYCQYEDKILPKFSVALPSSLPESSSTMISSTKLQQQLPVIEYYVRVVRGDYEIKRPLRVHAVPQRLLVPKLIPATVYYPAGRSSASRLVIGAKIANTQVAKGSDVLVGLSCQSNVHLRKVSLELVQRIQWHGRQKCGGHSAILSRATDVPVNKTAVVTNNKNVVLQLQQTDWALHRQDHYTRCAIPSNCRSTYYGFLFQVHHEIRIRVQTSRWARNDVSFSIPIRVVTPQMETGAAPETFPWSLVDEVFPVETSSSPDSVVESSSSFLSVEELSNLVPIPPPCLPLSPSFLSVEELSNIVPIPPPSLPLSPNQ